MTDELTQPNTQTTPVEGTESPQAGDLPRTGDRKPKGRYSAPRGDPTKRQTGKKEPYAYTIKDKAFGEFNVLNTANGWWAERGKVERLIDAYKIDANDDEACFYAGILRTNLQYFQEQHPEFLYIKHACRQNLGMKAKIALANKIEKEPEWYLERKRKDEYSTRSEVTGANGRELFDGLTAELRELGEALRSETPHHDDQANQKHTDVTRTDDAHAGQDGARHEAPAPADVLEG